MTENSVSNMAEKEKINPGSGFALGGVMIFMIITISEAAIPGYSIRTDAISYLGGAGASTALFWNAGLLVFGILWVTSSYLLFRRVGRLLHSIVFYLAGLGFIIVSLSPWNVSPTLHGIGAQSAFIFGAISCLISPGLIGGHLKKISYALGFFAFSVYISGYLGLEYMAFTGSGGVERMLYYPVILWEIVFGSFLMAAPEKLSAGIRKHGNDETSPG